MFSKAILLKVSMLKLYKKKNVFARISMATLEATSLGAGAREVKATGKEATGPSTSRVALEDRAGQDTVVRGPRVTSRTECPGALMMATQLRER